MIDFGARKQLMTDVSLDFRQRSEHIFIYKISFQYFKILALRDDMQFLKLVSPMSNI